MHKDVNLRKTAVEGCRNLLLRTALIVGPSCVYALALLDCILLPTHTIVEARVVSL